MKLYWVKNLEQKSNCLEYYSLCKCRLIRRILIWVNKQTPTDKTYICFIMGNNINKCYVPRITIFKFALIWFRHGAAIRHVTSMGHTHPRRTMVENIVTVQIAMFSDLLGVWSIIWRSFRKKYKHILTIHELLHCSVDPYIKRKIYKANMHTFLAQINFNIQTHCAEPATRSWKWAIHQKNSIYNKSYEQNMSSKITFPTNYLQLDHFRSASLEQHLKILFHQKDA